MLGNKSRAADGSGGPSSRPLQGRRRFSSKRDLAPAVDGGIAVNPPQRKWRFKRRVQREALASFPLLDGKEPTAVTVRYRSGNHPDPDRARRLEARSIYLHWARRYLGKDEQPLAHLSVSGVAETNASTTDEKRRPIVEVATLLRVRQQLLGPVPG